MNILDFWPDYVGEVEVSEDYWNDIFQRREDTFLGFLKVEAEKGFLKPSSIHLSQTQDMVRILLFRTLEEFSEALDADDIKHHQEEIIDALNFLYSIYFLDTSYLNGDDIIRELMSYIPASAFYGDILTINDLGQLTYYCGEFGDYLRNRSWMNQPQDLYFNGSVELLKLFRKVTTIAFRAFKNFDEFYRFYVAKDEVLKFRIRSKY